MIQWYKERQEEMAAEKGTARDWEPPIVSRGPTLK